MAPGRQRETPERDAEEGGVLRRAAQGLGEDVPETEIHQQARQEEAGFQTGPKRLTGKKQILQKRSAHVTSNALYVVRNLRVKTLLRVPPWTSPLTASSLSTGEDLVPEPADEVEELEGAGAAVLRGLPRADAAHQSQPSPGPERRGQEVLRRGRGGGGRGVCKRESEVGGVQRLLSFSVQ